VNNPDAQLTESILVCLRDICGEKERDDFVTQALIEEVNETLSLQTLFRSGSVGTRLFAALYRVEGVDWLSQAIKPLFNELSNLTHPVEFDPSKVAPGATADDILHSAQEFEAIARRFFNHLFMLAEDFPPCISRILFPVCEAAEKKFPGRGSSVAGIGLVILRYVSPAVLQPSQFNVPQPDFSANATRVVVVLSKVIQMVANGVVVKPNDVAMQPIANFIQSMFAPCSDFIKLCIKNPEIAPLPPPPVSDGIINKELRRALKVLATEVDKNFDKISSKAKEDNDTVAQAALTRLKNPSKIREKSRTTFGFFRGGGDHKQDNTEEEVVSPPSAQAPVEVPPSADDAVVAAHKSLDEMLMKFRASVLAYSGENFANVVNDYEKCKAELEKEREQRKVADKMIASLQSQIQLLQQEIATLRAAPPTTPTTPATPAAQVRPPLVGSPPQTRAADPKTTNAPKQMNMQSRLPCAAQNRQAVALLDEVLMLSGRITRVSQVLYLARIVRELQRLIRTPYEEQFEFAKNLTYNPTAGEDASVSFDDEKMHGLRRAIPDCISKVREWCIDMLDDGVVSPTYFPGVCLRMQNLVDILKDVSQTLRTSVLS